MDQRHFPSTQGSHRNTPRGPVASAQRPIMAVMNVVSVLFCFYSLALTNGHTDHIYIILIYDNMKDHNRSFLNKCKFCCPNCYVMSHASLSMASNGGSPGAPHFKSCHFKRVIVAIIVFWSSCGAGSFFKTRQPIDKPNHTYMAPLFPAAQIAR